MKSKPSEKALYDGLKKLIDDNKNTELKCRKYLKYANELLFRERERVLEYLGVETEYRLHSGNSDYVVAAKIMDEQGRTCNRAYLWETKAPQHRMFVKETNTRAQPSRYLYKGINQLLHYYRESKFSGDFCETFNIQPDNVKLGGIIIGSDSRKISTKMNENVYHKASLAWDCFWENAHIRLMNWNRILEWIGPKAVYEKRQYP
jgi:hypothetical protein